MKRTGFACILLVVGAAAGWMVWSRPNGAVNGSANGRGASSEPDLRTLVVRASDKDWRVRAGAFAALDRRQPLSVMPQRDTPMATRESIVLAWVDAHAPSISAQLCELFADAADAEYGATLVGRCQGCHVGEPPRPPAAPERCVDCHAAIHDQWWASAHARSLSHLRLPTVDPFTRQPGWFDFGNQHGLGCSACHRATGPGDGSGDGSCVAAFEPIACTSCHADAGAQWDRWRASEQPGRALWPPGSIEPARGADERGCVACHMPESAHVWGARRDVPLLRRGIDLALRPRVGDGGVMDAVLTNLSGHADPTGTRRRALALYVSVDGGPVDERHLPALDPGEQRRIAMPTATRVVHCRLVYVRNRYAPESYTVEITRAERRVTETPARDAAHSNGELALVGGTIHVSPTEQIADGTVLIRDGEIVAVGDRASIEVPPTTPAHDCSGLAITAGFWNGHVHLFEKKWAKAADIPASDLARMLEETFTRFGFTSVFDTGSEWENTRAIRDRIESGEVAGPRILTTGEPLIARNAMPPARALDLMGFMAIPAPEIVDAAQAEAAARRLLETGVDGIKIHLQPPPAPDPPFPQEAIPIVVAEARRAGRPVFVHPDTGADVRAAVRAGVHVIAHTTPRSGPWDESVLAMLMLKNAGVALTPTLTLWKRSPDRDRLTTVAAAQVRAWRDAGGSVIFGTDVGAVAPDPRDEYALMADAGMGCPEILASLTTVPAGRFAEPGGGRIAAGLRADLVVLEGDPSADIRALADVRCTLRAGVVISGTAPSAAPPRPGR